MLAAADIANGAKTAAVVGAAEASVIALVWRAGHAVLHSVIFFSCWNV